MFRKKILIIDDSELMVKLITDILQGRGYKVVSASDGFQGLRKVAEEKPDLVLLDIVMPGMDGFEVCKILREDPVNNLMPIIMLTAQENEDDKLTGLELGADDYIIKPFNPRELLSRINNTLIRIDRNRWANPLTGLKGNLEIQAEINRRIALNRLFSVIYLDIDNFKAFNDVYGFPCGDRAIKITADIIMDNVQMYGSADDFIGHIGGDDFIIVSGPGHVDSLCGNIIKSFDARMPDLYTNADRRNGFISTANRQGRITRYPIMSISLAVITNERRNIVSHIQIGEIAAELKRKAKAMEGSVYIKDRRKEMTGGHQVL